jgi:hypothetical protein
MRKIKIYNYKILFISVIWIINGLYCKLLNFVPRHQEIVSIITNIENPSFLTKFIGLLEIFLGLLIIISDKCKILAILQITLILTMNIIEFTLAPEMLLWGKFNIVFALLFISFIYYTYFIKINLHVSVS